jgi:hypothetical protein
MDAFKVVRRESVEYAPLLPSRAGGHGFRAPGRMTMVLREGCGWVMSQNGVPEPISALTVVGWDTGDWVAYGSDGTSEFKADLYWATNMPEGQRQAGLSEAFGPSSQ